MTDEMVTYEEIAALKARVAAMLRAATQADHLLWGIYGYGSVSEQYDTLEELDEALSDPPTDEQVASAVEATRRVLEDTDG